MEEFRRIRDRVRVNYPHFDLKLILAWGRGESMLDTWDHIEQAVELRCRHPDLISGYDLVGREDTGLSDLHYLELWMHLDRWRQQCGVDLPVFFHAGESLSSRDLNLYDAVLLGAKRIGHGFNLYRFPNLQRLIIERNVALEICPISNQLLGVCKDLRLHPAGAYLRQGVQCVLSSDDSGLFGYEGLSYDFWEATMAWELGLGDLKKLAYNSLEYSNMNPDEKRSAIDFWRQEWDKFIAAIKMENAMAEQ